MRRLTHCILLPLILLTAAEAIAQPPSSAPATRPSTVKIREFDVRADRRYSTQQPTLSPDGKRLAFGAADIPGGKSAISVYDVTGGPAVYEATGPLDGSFWLAAFSPDSRKAAIIRPTLRAKGQVDVTAIEIVDLSSGRILYTFEAAPALTSGSILFSPDGNNVLFPPKRPDQDPDYDKAVYAVVDLNTGERVKSYKFPSFDGARLISEDGSRVLSWRGVVLDGTSGAKVTQLEWPQDYAPLAMCIIEQGKRIRAIDRDYSVRAWDAQTGKHLGHTKAAKQYPHGFSADFNKAGDRYFLNLYRGIVMFDAATATPMSEWTLETTQGRIVEMSPRGGAIVLTVEGRDTVEILTMAFPSERDFKPIQPTTREAARRTRHSTERPAR